MNIHSRSVGEAHGAPDPASSVRERILEAALALFAERGFHGTPVPMIAERAGVATGSLYRHFAGKEELVNVLYRDAKQRFMAAVASDVPEDAGPRELFRRLCQRIVAHAATHGTELAFLELHHHGTYLDAQSLDVEARALRTFDAFFERPAVRAATRPLAPRALVTVVWGVLSGAFRAIRMGQLELDAQLVTAIEQCAWDAVRQPT